MKLSLSWIFDHIASSWREHDIPHLLQKLHATTAEVEGYEFYSIDLSLFTVVQIIAHTGEQYTAHSKELKQEITVHSSNQLQQDSFYLLKQETKGWRLAIPSDFGGTKEGALPALYVTESEFAGGWKETFEKDDYVITIGNTSITHRPDLWSHRGFAREIAALLGCSLVDEKHFLTDFPVQNLDEEGSDHTAPLQIVLETKDCSHLSALYMPKIEWRPSLLPMMHRLVRVDSKPIDAIVDATNYVMFDIGQPMHAFDASFFDDKKLVVTRASQGESVTLLDGHTVELTSHATVITNGSKSLSLAGIMGGMDSAVTKKTTALVIDAAHYNAPTLRMTAAHYKLRTESSTRFEKSLDPMQTTPALLRFLHIMDKNGIAYLAQGPLVYRGHECKPHHIVLTHEMIEKKLGVALTYEFVVKTLNALGFGVHYESSQGRYTVRVPSFRAKDVTIAEDIVEEVGRFFGYDTIPHELPCLPLKPISSDKVEKIYTIKQFLAYTAHAREVRNYALYDEEFLRAMQWQSGKGLTLKNPISEHQVRLVTSLIPNLFKTIHTNRSYEDQLSFFEWNKIWPHEDFLTTLYGTKTEVASCAGIFFDEKNPVDFYQKKDILVHLFKQLNLEIVWIKADHDLAPWYHPYKTAFLRCKEKVMGVAGSVNPGFIAPFLLGDAFIFELNGDALLALSPQEIEFIPLAKYQDTWRDISMIAPVAVTVQSVLDRVQAASSLIFNVELLDFFHKDEWRDKRSLTVRFFACDTDKTLSSEDIEALYAQVVETLKPLGVEIR